MQDAMQYTDDEIMAVCISRQVENGEVIVQGIATPLVMAGYMLAKCTHAPDLVFASAIGQGICQDWSPLRLARAEEVSLGKAISNFGFVSIATEMLPRFTPKEFFRPAQVDSAGNFNNIAVGQDYQRPRMRLPGSGGIPDVTTFSHDVFLYVPHHSRASFVAEVDFVAGLGHVEGRTRGSGPKYLVSNLGEFDFASGRLRLISLHPGIELDRVKSKTGFSVEISPDLCETQPPSYEDIRLLREQIDPLGVRRLDTMRAGARKDALRDILAREREI